MAALGHDAYTGELRSGDVSKFIKGNTPWINLFYIKPALDHLLFNNIQEMLDPGSLRRLEMEQRRKGTEYWMPPSEVNNDLPDSINLSK
jgi:hypothetical protein